MAWGEMMRKLVLGAALVVLAGAAVAEGNPEEAVLNGARVTLHPVEFLTAEEQTTLRLVLTNAQALALFVPGAAEGAGAKGHAALAMSPDEGFIRDGKPVASATALAELPDAAAAASAAIAACDAARASDAAACVLVLEVAPAE